MIDNAERLVRADDVQPGDLVAVSGQRLIVDSVTVAAEETTLSGRWPQSQSTRLRHVKVPRGYTVSVLADRETLDAIEGTIVEMLDPAPGESALDGGIRVVPGGLVVIVGGVEWTLFRHGCTSPRLPADEAAAHESLLRRVGADRTVASPTTVEESPAS